MRQTSCFVIVILMSLLSTADAVSQTLPAPSAITDPKLLASPSNLNVAKLAIEKLYATRGVSGGAWSPDGKSVVFVSNISGRNNLWTVSADSGWPTQLTVSDQRQASPQWSPDGHWISYISDHDGDEQWDIFLVSPSTGEVANLTNTREIAEMDQRWSPDGKKLAYVVKAKTAPNWEIDVYDMAYRKATHLTSSTAPDWSNNNPIWSAGGRQIVYTRSHAGGKDSNVWIAEVADGTSTNLTAHEGEKLYDAADISPDGKLVLITSNAANGYMNVGLINVATKNISWLTKDKWEIEAGGFSPDGKSLTWIANVDGNSDVFSHDLATGKTTVLPFPKGVNQAGRHGAFSKDGARLLFSHNGPTSPNDFWIYDRSTGKSHQVTHSLIAGVRSEDLVAPVLAHYPSHDHKFTISALVYAPYNLPRNGQHPAIVYIHGGPASQTVNSFNRIVQFMVNQGYFVIAPNYRGSTGYGKEFQEANFRDFGGGDLQDVLGAADWIKQTGYVDPKKLIVMGGSYGGYLSMMAVTKAPEVWAAGVPIVPFVNWFTEIENEDPELQQYDKANMGDPEKDSDFLRDRSPIFFVDKIKAPLLLLAGGNDPRCPKTEAQQVADAVKKNGGTAELKIYENEGHGFARVENQLDAYRRVAEFLKAKVPPADCSCSLNE